MKLLRWRETSYQTPQEFTNQSEWNTKCHLNSSFGMKNWRCISLCCRYILKLALLSSWKHLVDLCWAFRRLSWSQPRVAKALSSSSPAFRMIIQHAKEEIREYGGFLQQEVTFLHQNIIQAPEPQWTNTTQVTWMWNMGLHNLLKDGKYKTCLQSYLYSRSTVQSIYPKRQ